MIIQHPLKYPIETKPSAKTIVLDLAKFTFGVYLKHYSAFADIESNTTKPFKSPEHVERWYRAMDAFTLAVSDWDAVDISQLKTPDRNSINKHLAEWMTFEQADLAKSYIEHGYDAFPLQVPIETEKRKLESLIIEVPTVATSLAYDKAKTQLDKDWCIFRGMTDLSDDEIKALAMPDYAQAKLRAYDFLVEEADFFPSSP